MAQPDSDAVFVSLVEQSWQYYEEEIRNSRLDDVLVGGVVASLVHEGFALIDLESDGAAHYLRFENTTTNERTLFRLQNLSEGIMTAKVLGHRANVMIGFGQRVANAGQLLSMLKSEMKSAYLDHGEPGIITIDADITSGYIYAQVSLILNLDAYFNPQDWLDIRYDVLRNHLGNTVASLRKYLVGRTR